MLEVKCGSTNLPRRKDSMLTRTFLQLAFRSHEVYIDSGGPSLGLRHRATRRLARLRSQPWHKASQGLLGRSYSDTLYGSMAGGPGRETFEAVWASSSLCRRRLRTLLLPSPQALACSGVSWRGSRLASTVLEHWPTRSRELTAEVARECDRVGSTVPFEGKESPGLPANEARANSSKPRKCC